MELNIHYEPMIVYRIIPDKSVSNKNNNDIIRSLHDYTNFFYRFTRKGLTITYHPRDHFYFRYILKPNDIRFYMIAPQSYSTLTLQQFEHKFPKATILEASINEIQLPQNDTLCCEVKYRRSNMFSLHTDRREETTPIQKILSNVHNMKNNDLASIDIQFISENRINWQDWIERQHEIFKQGKTPKRLIISSRDIYLTVISTLGSIIDNLLDFISTLGNGIFPKMQEEKINYVSKAADIEKKIILIDGKLDRSTNDKINLPIYKTIIRCLSYSEHPDRRKITLKSLANSFTELNGDNELQRIELSTKTQIRCIWEFNNLNVSWKTALMLDNNTMSCDEVGKLIQLPTAELQEEFSSHLEIINKKEVLLSEEITQGGIYLGNTTYKGKSIKTFIPISDWSILCRPHLGIGKVGTGKTTLGSRVAVDFCSNKFTSICIDVADGAMIDEARDALPEDFPEDHIIDLDFGNIEYPIPLNWSEITTKIGNNNNNVIDIQSRKISNKLSALLIDFINRMATSETTTRMEHYLSAIAKPILVDPRNGLLEVILGLTSENYRNELLQSGKIKDPLIYNTIRQLHGTTDPTVVKSILERLTVLLSNDYMRNCILQQNKLNSNGDPLINFRKWIDGNYFIGIRVPKEELGPIATDRLVSYIIAKIWLSALSRYDLPIKNGIHGKPFVLIQDEPHQFKSSYYILDDTVREARKWGMKLFWLAHKLEDFNFMEDTLSAAGVQYSLYSSSEKTYKKLLPELNPFTLDDLFRLPDKWWAIHKLSAPKGNESIPAFLTQMAPPLKKIEDRDYRRIECSKYYGRYIEDVEKDIFSRSEILYQQKKNKNQGK